MMPDNSLLLFSRQEIPIFQSALQRHTLPKKSDSIVRNVEIYDENKQLNCGFIVYLL